MSISVLMSVYRSERPDFLSRAIRSIWTDQTVKPDEIILVKDGTLTPALNDVIDQWKKEIGKPLVILKNKKNIGLTKSLNKGIKVAKCDYIARMDSDDISLPQRFERQLQFMLEHPEIDVVGTGLQEIDENETLKDVRLYPEENKKIKAYIGMANPIAHPTSFIRRSVFKDTHYDERFVKNQDLKLWIDLLSSGHQLHNLPEVLFYFRRTSDTYAKRSSRVSLRSELNIYLYGISKLHGKYNRKKVYPLARYVIKSMPRGVNKLVYKYLFRKRNV